MRATTLIIANQSFTSSQLWLNHKEESLTSNPRLQAVISALLARAEDVVIDGKIVVKKEEWKNFKLQIISVNNFPTAAGLASSAAGYACFTRCLAELYRVKEEFVGELSSIARMGSGSACRSLDGGWVKWLKGEREDGKDSIAQQIVAEDYWPEMRILILVANAAQKETSSTDGMQRSVETSPFLSYRAKEIVEGRMKEMEESIRRRDFEKFGQLTMQDSNSFHSTCLDTYPPIFYLNETSKHVIHVVHALNARAGKIVAAYTFDAGPNAVIYLLEKELNGVLDVFLHYYLPSSASPQSFLHDPTGISEYSTNASKKVNVNPELIASIGERKESTKLFQIIVTKVGKGASVVSKKSTF